MKKLSSKDLGNLTVTKAWEVVDSFAKYLEEGNLKFLEFEDELEWDRESILVSILFLIRKNTNNEEFVNALCTNIVILFSSFMPTPEEYKKKLELKEHSDKYS